MSTPKKTKTPITDAGVRRLGYQRREYVSAARCRTLETELYATRKTLERAVTIAMKAMEDVPEDSLTGEACELIKMQDHLRKVTK